jgi:hypothetical protein
MTRPRHQGVVRVPDQATAGRSVGRSMVRPADRTTPEGPESGRSTGPVCPLVHVADHALIGTSG